MAGDQQDAEYRENKRGVDVLGGDGEQVVPENPTPVPDALPIGSIKALFTDNLFKDVKNSILTVVFGAIVIWATYKAFGFVFLNEKVAQDGTVRSAWEVLRDGPFFVYMVGNRFAESGVSYAELWIGIYLVAAIAGLGSGRPKPIDTVPASRRAMAGILFPPAIGLAAILSQTRTIIPALLSLGMIAMVLVTRFLAPHVWRAVGQRMNWVLGVLALLAYGMLLGFNPASLNNYGGLLLTVLVAFTAITLAFPIGVVMALARRSSFPLIRPVAVLYIELIRGVPLITLLFMGQFAIGFFFPPSMAVPGPVARAIIMITLFTGAYVAEIVRGGLQSVPNGQIEAGQAVGLSPLTVTRKIVLPQALRTSIPALVGQFISVLKDTSLLIIIGLLDLLGVTKPILGNLNFSNQGFTSEAYAFVAFLFWVMCFSMSRASQRLETRLGVGKR